MALFCRPAAIVILVAQLTPARADTPAPRPAASDDNVDAARAHYKKGKTLFDLQRFTEAAHEYEAAYEAKNDPALLFNIGQSYRLAGDHAAALGAYRAYLRNRPDAPNRADVEKRIEDLQRLVSEERRNREAPPQDVEPVKPPTTAQPTTEPAPALVKQVEPPARRRSRYLGIGLASGGAAVTIVGGVLVGLAYGIQSSQSHPGATTTYDPSAPGRMQGEQIGGGVMLGVGLAAIASGVVVYFVGGRR